MIEKSPAPGPVQPRVLLSIDYEPWFAFTHRYDAPVSTHTRRELDGGFARSAIDAILGLLGEARASFYLVGEIADWYPEVPRKIVQAGHELGFHCQVHRTLIDAAELADDLQVSAYWRRDYRVYGYRAPMVGISEAGYALLKAAGFSYSSSIYAAAGTLLQKDGIWELPVSTARIGRGSLPLAAPRDFSLRLLLSGEVPYGSSFTIGVMGDVVLRFIERDLRAGHSPVIILHPHELVRPPRFVRRTIADLARRPLLLPFLFDKSKFLARLLREFPVSPLGTYLDEVLRSRQDANV